MVQTKDMDLPQVTIVYEDGDIVAINKPSGLLVHAAPLSQERAREERFYLTDWIRTHYPQMETVWDAPAMRPGIVHRLDQTTSGIMVLCKTQVAFAYYKSLFQAHTINKCYLALVAGVPRTEEGVVDRPIGRVAGTVRRSVFSKLDAKSAKTLWKVKEQLGQYTLIEVSPLTGRTHQVRVHLKSAGLPIVGDFLYGNKKQPSWAGRIYLHAFSIEFTSRTGERLKLEAPLPDDFLSVVNMLKTV